LTAEDYWIHSKKINTIRQSFIKNNCYWICFKRSKSIYWNSSCYTHCEIKLVKILKNDNLSKTTETFDFKRPIPRQLWGKKR
jgi:hypothetical protein